MAIRMFRRYQHRRRITGSLRKSDRGGSTSMPRKTARGTRFCAYLRRSPDILSDADFLRSSGNPASFSGIT
jgi:hypothetical protein